MKPIKLQRMKRTNCWSPKGKVWFQKNDDNRLGARLHREAQEEFNKGNYEEANFKKQRSNWMLGHSKDDEASQVVSTEY